MKEATIIVPVFVMVMISSSTDDMLQIDSVYIYQVRSTNRYISKRRSRPHEEASI